jgi:hypothetical protein
VNKCTQGLVSHLTFKEAWLAGLVDGEGCLTVGIWPQHVRTLKFNLLFSISMKRGDWEAVASSVLTDHQIPFHTSQRKNQFGIIINGNESVKKLIHVLSPYLVVKKPLAEKLLTFPKAPPRNRFSSIDDSYLDEVCQVVDYVRRFNRSKNRRHKWDGKTIRSFYGK